MPFHIHFRDTPHSDKLRSECEGWADGLRSEFPETSRVEVTVSHDGGLRFHTSQVAGRHVSLRAEMDVLCLISNCPQLNNPCNAYNPTPIRVMTWDNA